LPRGCNVTERGKFPTCEAQINNSSFVVLNSPQTIAFKMKGVRRIG
jgi:hypothetical protein